MSDERKKKGRKDEMREKERRENRGKMKERLFHPLFQGKLNRFEKIAEMAKSLKLSVELEKTGAFVPEKSTVVIR